MIKSKNRRRAEWNAKVNEVLQSIDVWSPKESSMAQRLGVDTEVDEILQSIDVWSPEVALQPQRVNKPMELIEPRSREGKAGIEEAPLCQPVTSGAAARMLDRGPAKVDEYVDFELYVDRQGYVRASSPQGDQVAETPIVVSADIQGALDSIERNRVDEKLLTEFGKHLYRAIFSNRINVHFGRTEAAARSQRIRIRLTIEPDTLGRLPWEFMYREEGDYFLAANPDTVLSRYLSLPWYRGRVRRRTGSLDMLVIIANPEDQAQLNPAEWEEIILNALAEPIKDGLIATRMVKRATFEHIRDALLQRHPDIIQFVGHGIYMNGKGYLALVDSDKGNTWEIDDMRFANMLLGVNEHLGLVSLATCEGAKSDSQQGFLGIAPRIVQRGVPAVVAMQYKVRVKTAKVFLENFYKAVAERYPVDWATQFARNMVSVKQGLDNREFATPVLYMRAKDGMIF